MRIYAIASVMELGLVLSVSAKAQNAELTVLATMDPWKAGGYDDDSDGIPPAVFTFTAGEHQFITFSRVTGNWNCGAGPLYGPDGADAKANCNGPHSYNDPIGPFAGIYTTDFYGALVGMFLEDALPTSAPTPLRFFVSNNTEGGKPTDFRVLVNACETLKIGQVFFIGDGLTGTGTGELQAFFVPPTATHLYLGYPDGSNGIPQGYSNNTGSLKVVLELHQIH
jgi:hypothetical protein